MPHVVVERTFESPASVEELPAQLRGNESGNLLQRGFVAGNGKHAVGLYEVPDLEALSSLAAEGPGRATASYPVHLLAHSLPERPKGYSVVVAQRDLSGMEGLTVEAVEHLASDPLGCYGRLRVHHIGGYLSHDLQRMVCVYFAPDMESVRKANRENGTPWEHLWRGELVQPA